MDLTQIIGILGAGMVLLAFFLTNKPGYDSSKNKLDEWLNFLGSVLLIYNAWVTGAVPFLILNTVWALWSLRVLLLKTGSSIRQKGQ